MRPQLWVVAGPNGAGKSTLADRYLAGRIPVINPDNIALERPGIGPAGAGRMAIQRQREHLQKRESFAWETTLSGHRELALMREARDAGYKVNLVYIGVRDPGLSMLRITERVAAGGHTVPASDVARRFERSLANLPDAMALADRALILDNSEKRRRLVLIRERDHSRFRSTSMPDWLQSRLPAEMSARERLRAKVEQRAGELAAERERERPAREIAHQRERAQEKQRGLEQEQQRTQMRKKDHGLEP